MGELKENVIRDAAEKNIKYDVFGDLDSYSRVMTISQVVKYFSRHDMNSFTKTMIQNYVRVNVLPPPNDKKHYENNHLFTLALIDSLKNTFSLDEIRAFFELEDGGFNNRHEIYKQYLEEYNRSLSEIVREADTDSEHADDAHALDLLFNLMAKSVSYKQMAQSLLERLTAASDA